LFARDSSRAGGLIERFCTMMYLRPTLIVYKYKLQIATLPRPKCDLYFTILIVHKQKPQIQQAHFQRYQHCYTIFLRRNQLKIIMVLLADEVQKTLASAG